MNTSQTASLWIAPAGPFPSLRGSTWPARQTDPKLIALLDQRQKALADAERLVRPDEARPSNRLDKARRTVARLEKRIEQHRNPLAGVNTAAV